MHSTLARVSVVLLTALIGVACSSKPCNAGDPSCAAGGGGSHAGGSGGSGGGSHAGGSGGSGGGSAGTGGGSGNMGGGSVDAGAACTTNTDCANPMPFCDLTAHVCRGCGSAAECNGLGGTCNADGSCALSCAGCLSNGICQPGTNAPACGTGGAACSTCSGGTNVCRAGSCVQCASNNDCSGTSPICNSGPWICVGCTADAQCGSGNKCNPDGSCTGCATGCTQNGACQPGTAPSACGANGAACTSCGGATPVCRFGSCVQCASNNDCGGTKPICNSGPWTCVGCTSDVQCGSGNKCNPDGSCNTCPTGCLQNGVCQPGTDPAACGATGAACTSCGGATPVCRFGSCVQCAMSSDCPPATPICNSGPWTCVKCTADVQCGSGKCNPDGTCNNCPFGCYQNGVCEQGNVANACGTTGGTCQSCAGATPVCRAGTCVQCASNSDCGGTKPVCNSGPWVCVGCNNDNQCNGGKCMPDGSCNSCVSGCLTGTTCNPGTTTQDCGPAGGYCSTCSGTTPICRFGSCVQCASSNDCTVPKPICNSGPWTCVSCATVGCGTGQVCTPDGSCQPGPCSGCYVGSVCYPFDAQHCGPAGAACNAVCSGATPVCRFGSCVQCASSNDCSVPKPICNPGPWTCASCPTVGCGGGQVCSAYDGACAAACTGPSDCAARGGICHSDGTCSNVCYGCYVGNICYPGSEDARCFNGNEASCTACGGSTPYCVSSFCKQCRGNSDCTTGAHTCQNGTCI